MWVEIIGWIGSVLILGSYVLNLKGKITADSTLYIWSNIVGGLCFVVNTYYHHAFPSMVVNVIWVFFALQILFKNKIRK